MLLQDWLEIFGNDRCNDFELGELENCSCQIQKLTKKKKKNEKKNWKCSTMMEMFSLSIKFSN